MTEFEIAVAGEQAQLLSSRGQLTYRMAGAKLHFSFDGEWDGLTPVALVRQGDAAVAVPMETDTAIIPGHALTMVGDFVYAGVYGVSADGLVAIPTVWVRLGRLRDGAHIFYDEDTLPNTPIWQTMGEQLGDLSRLQTPEKTNLVDAVNSLSADSLGAISAPDTGEVGQVLGITQTEEGRPTLWKAVSLPRCDPFVEDWGEPIATVVTEEEVNQIRIDPENGPYREYLVSFKAAPSSTATARYMPGTAWIGNAFTGNQDIAMTAAHTQSGNAYSLWYAGISQEGVVCGNAVRSKHVVYIDEGQRKDKVTPAAAAALNGIGFRAGDGHCLGIGTEIKVWGRK